MRIYSLGVSDVENCRYFEGREDKVVKECVKVDTDAFSAWSELMDGIGNIAVKIITFGFKGN